MGTATFDFARLLAPTGTQTFLKDHWETQPLVLHRRDRGHYSGLFSAADVDHVIAFTRPQFPGPQAAKSFVQGCLPDRQPAPPVHYPGVADLRHTFGAGKTVVIRSMQNRWPAVAALCRNLEGVFQCPVHTNLYLTPPRSQGFEPHIDTHEVFALQIDGAKTWRLYDFAADRPLADAPTGLRRSDLGPPREVRLEPGDLLYLPRGYAHEAFTTTSPSLHLTVGVNVYRWLDLMHEALVAAARRDVGLRASVPPGALLSSTLPNDVTRTFQELLRALADNAQAGEAVQQLASRFFDGLDPLPDGYFAFSEADEHIGSETVLTKRPGGICRVLVAGDTALLEFPGGRLGGPIRIAPALRFFAETDRFVVRDMPDMSADAKLVLARRAVREGLFVVHANPAAPLDDAGAARRPVESGV
ncbi:cupin domain-containing protein [Frigoriglobus tundricola]|uniref:JmjC domain-containing protein n=1 Tax=Frigoriglobus tundricola TaxID=2774151 RepID=A0A6M5YK76_9BACT|nr:cupin domain-containing protein [Frigoriglobus tundricola]QJW93686.1 hypothetical protein FTUN_1194 [Frigoriglobus tundricola]